MQIIQTLTLVDAEDIFTVVGHEAQTDGGKPVAMVVLNATGDVLLGKTMDDVKGPSFWNAYRKACTALKFRRPTVAFRFEASGGRWVPTKKSWVRVDIVTAMSHDTDFCAWAGGVPLYCDDAPSDQLVPAGAIGISNREELEDHDLAMKCPARFL